VFLDDFAFGRLTPQDNTMDFTKLDGLIPAVIQDAATNEVLMVGFMNEEALALTQTSGFATFFSRTRNKLWMKGETSGNRLEVLEMLTDCDDDTVLLKVKRLGDGNVCHTGERTCFYRPLAAE
jgi:phosphoribosyl-ATP pyrophosphohydrolase/phosphoribosyl-AMP cyclohydrolase